MLTLSKTHTRPRLRTLSHKTTRTNTYMHNYTHIHIHAHHSHSHIHAHNSHSHIHAHNSHTCTLKRLPHAHSRIHAQTHRGSFSFCECTRQLLYINTDGIGYDVIDTQKVEGDGACEEVAEIRTHIDNPDTGIECMKVFSNKNILVYLHTHED